MKPTTMDQLKVGDKAETTKTISEYDVYAFAGITGDFNPLHINEVYAASTRFEHRLAHGSLLVGLISAVLGMKSPGLGALYISQSLKFLAPVMLNDTITAQVEITSLDLENRLAVYKTRCINQKQVVVAEGESTLKLPKAK